MKICLTIWVALLVVSTSTIAEHPMTVGEQAIDGRKLKPYSLTWQQCLLSEGQWQDGGVLTEELVVVGKQVFRHRQTTLQPGGVEVQATTYFDQRSFAPLRMETRASRDGKLIAYQERELSDHGYTGYASQGEERKPLTGAISSKMLHGGAMGLPLATILYRDEPLELTASMMSFDATYRVIATWAGRETLEFEGNKVEAWLVDVQWHHQESGDVYPPGPDGSGGRYWLVPDPPSGFPYVPQYQTDTYIVAFANAPCAAASAQP